MRRMPFQHKNYGKAGKYWHHPEYCEMRLHGRRLIAPNQKDPRNNHLVGEVGGVDRPGSLRGGREDT